MNPRVSVATVCYNHDRYIGQSLESSLTQETDFEYEVVVGDDNSTDGSREIEKECAAKNPSRLKLNQFDKNVGKQLNYLRTIDACEGEYIAILDSDDYWTSPNKLATQVRFMDENPEHAISYHRCEVFFEDGSRKGFQLPEKPVAITGLNELLRENYIPNSTVMYRRSALPKLPDWFARFEAQDWALHILTLCKGGTAGFIDENMAVYRMHPASTWSSVDERKRLEDTISMFSHFLEVVPKENKKAALLGLSERLYDLLNYCRRRKDFEAAKKAFGDWLALESLDCPIPAKKKLRLKLWLALHI